MPSLPNPLAAHPGVLRPPETPPAADAWPLPRGGTVELPAQPGLVVACLQGLLWLRQQGDADDHLLRAGQCWHARALAPVVVEALADARFRLEAG